MITPSILEELIKIRRHLHQNPEIGYQEHATADFICTELDKLNIPYKRGIAKTGIIAELNKGDLPFASKKPGVMHACGHDVHTTMLLGACMLLKNKNFKGKIKFIFQPSEEGVNKDPENKSGGQRIVESGELDDMNYAIALHVNPLLETGVLSYALGNVMANSSNFTIIVRGKSGHAGAAPHLAIDAILVACNLIQNLHTIVARNISPTQTDVVSITKISGGTAPNIIADCVEITGTIRALELEVFNIIKERFTTIIEGVSKSFGAQIELQINSFYPSVVNNVDINKQLLPLAQELFKEGVKHVDPILAGEDFAFYARKVPSMFYFIGAKNNSDTCFYLHHPKVIMNEDCISLGSDFLTKAALELLNNTSSK